MTDLAASLLNHGIRLPRLEPGNYKSLCPKCSHTRKDKKDPCLSVTVDVEGGAVWNCHNQCGNAGNVPGLASRPTYRPAAKNYPPIAKPTTSPLPKPAIDFFALRGISADVLTRNRIKWAGKWIPAANAEVGAIAFPYLRHGELVNVKYRTLSKQFAQEKGAEKIFFGLDDIDGQDDAIIVEGEIDKLALEMAGYINAISVPDGAPKRVKETPSEDDVKFSYIANCEQELTSRKRIILAVDNDESGRALEEELARRIGKEKCWRVVWPDSPDGQPCKDADAVLMAHGPEVLAECIRSAKPYPIESLHETDDYRNEVYAIYHGERKRAHPTGFNALNDYYNVVEGWLTVVTGIPNSGKSEFVDALMVNTAERFGWRHVVCSFENEPADHISKLAEKFLKMPFNTGPTARMDRAQLDKALDWINDRFKFIRFDGQSPTIDNILDLARVAIMRHGVRGMTIDPYNEIEHHRPAGVTETEYVSHLLNKVRRFARNHGIHVWFIAHPAKMYRDGGKLPVPSLYDISGSANWANKADAGFAVHRDFAADITDTEIHVHKIRSKWAGKRGVAALKYDRVTGVYSDPPPAPPARWNA